MYAVSNDYLSVLEQKTKTDRIEITLTLTDGSVINLDDSKLIRGSVYVNNQCLNGNEFHFGCTYAGECGFSFRDDVDRFTLIDAKVDITYYRLLSNDTEEQIPMGVYFVDEAERTYSITNVKAIDGMALLDISVSEQTVGSVYDLLTFLSTKCGFELGQTQEEIEALPNGAEMFSLYPDRIDTYRDALGYLSAVVCGFATFDRLGKLRISTFSNVENWEISNDFRIKSKFNDAETFYKGVTARFLANQNFYPYSHIEDERGDGLILDMGDIPIVQGTVEKKDLILSNIFNCLVGIIYRPCEVTYFGNPAIDLGDNISFSEGSSLITNISWKYRGHQTLKSIGLNPKLQAVKDKTYKQLVNMEANIDTAKLGTYTYINAENYDISNEAVKVITLQFSSVAECKALFLGSIHLGLSLDGEIELTYYINQTLDDTRTRRIYLNKGNNLISLFDWFDVEENARNELWVFLQPFFYESVERVQTASIETEKNRISALIESYSGSTEYVEPTPTEIDTSVPRISIAQNHVKALIFGQGLSTVGYVWDGTLNFEDEIPQTFSFEDVGELVIKQYADIVQINTQTPINSTFTDVVGTFRFVEADDLHISDKFVDILVFNDEQCVLVGTDDGVVRTLDNELFVVRNNT